MYKVFNNNALIILNLQDVQLSSIEHHIKVENKDVFNDLLTDYFSREKDGDILFFGYDTEKMFDDFCSYFKYIEAAGGIVRNTKGELLFIKRLGLWDFPKGKIEKDETPPDAAIREVEEETGVCGLQIIGELYPTYHIYGHSEKRKLKKTYWYDMKTNFEGNLIPQTLEDIELAVWKKNDQCSLLMQQSYRSLRESFRELLNY